MSRDPRLYLGDMRGCCRKVLRYAEGMTIEPLAADEKTFDVVMRKLEIVGESAAPGLVFGRVAAGLGKLPGDRRHRPRSMSSTNSAAETVLTPSQVPTASMSWSSLTM